MSFSDHPMNILIFSNASWMPTGYGNLTKHFSRALKNEGYGIVIAAYVGLQGAPIADDAGIIHLPTVRERFQNDVIQGHWKYAQSFYPDKRPTDIVWSILDIFAHDSFVWQQMPWASQTPIDCEPVGQNMRVPLSVCRYPIAVTRHAEQQMKAIGLSPLYVPWGIHTDVFKPIDRSLARQNMLSKHLITRPIPDDVFLVIVVANNGESYRKNFSGTLEAFQIFEAEHPGALLYIHADSSGVHGIPLDAMIEQLGLTGKVIFPSPYAILVGLPNDANLVDIYSAGDVKLMLSMGESPGLTDLESMSCGCPIIATNFGASAEINSTGWKVNGSLFQHIPLSYQMRPDPFEAAVCLQDAFNLWQSGGMPELRERTIPSVHDWDVQVIMKDHFIPALDYIHEDLKRTPHAEWLEKRKVEQQRAEPISTDWNGLTVEEPITPEQKAMREEMAKARGDILKEKIKARR